MRMFRVTLLAAAAVLLLPPSRAKAEDSIPWGMTPPAKQHSQTKAEDSVEAQFLGGTIKAIPADTFGSLSVKDATELRFQYGTTVYHLPYAQISETELTESNNKGHWLIHNPFKKQYQTLAIGFHDANGASNTLNFQIEIQVADLAEAAINQRCSRIVEANADPDSYWGDNIWKTQRTQRLWEQPKQKPTSASLAVGAAGTK